MKSWLWNLKTKRDFYVLNYEKEDASDHFDFNHADEPQTSNQEVPPLNLDQQAEAATILDAAA